MPTTKQDLPGTIQRSPAKAQRRTQRRTVGSSSSFPREEGTHAREELRRRRRLRPLETRTLRTCDEVGRRGPLLHVEGGARLRDRTEAEVTGFDWARREPDAERSRLQRIRSSLSIEEETAGAAELSVVDQAAVGTEMFERQRDISILEQVMKSLNDVDRAFRRLDDRSYGACEACSQPIDDDRLCARPENTLPFSGTGAREREEGSRPEAEG